MCSCPAFDNGGKTGSGFGSGQGVGLVVVVGVDIEGSSGGG